MTADHQTSRSDPHALASSLDLDERDVMSRNPGSFLPDLLQRATWSLGRRGLVRLSFPRRVSFTDIGRSVRAALLAGLDDEDLGWGILFVGRGRDAWWLADASGYTSDISEAGLFSRGRATEQHGRLRCNEGRDVAVPPARMRELLDSALADARAKVSKLERSFWCATHRPDGSRRVASKEMTR